MVLVIMEDLKKTLEVVGVFFKIRARVIDIKEVGKTIGKMDMEDSKI
jgi:hypothetical protein